MIDTKLARRYARGLLQAALEMDLEGQDPEQVAGQLQELSATIGGHSGLELLVETGLADQVLPELPAVRRESRSWIRFCSVMSRAVA